MTDIEKRMMALAGARETDFQKSDITGDAIAELADIIAVQDDAIAELAEIIGGMTDG